jgi:hypothetical protein
MFWPDNVVSSGFLGWWWLFPVVCIITCMLFCRFSGHHMACRRRSQRAHDIDELRKEIQALKQKVSSIK